MKNGKSTFYLALILALALTLAYYIFVDQSGPMMQHYRTQGLATPPLVNWLRHSYLNFPGIYLAITFTGQFSSGPNLIGYASLFIEFLLGSVVIISLLKMIDAPTSPPKKKRRPRKVS